MSAGVASGSRTRSLAVWSSSEWETAISTPGSLPNSASDGYPVPGGATYVVISAQGTASPRFRTGLLQVTYSATGDYRIGVDLGGAEGTGYVRADVVRDTLANANAVRAKLAADWLASVALSATGTLVNSGGVLVYTSAAGVWLSDAVGMQMSAAGGLAVWTGTLECVRIIGTAWGWDGTSWRAMMTSQSEALTIGATLPVVGWQRVAMLTAAQDGPSDVIPQGVTLTAQAALRFA